MTFADEPQDPIRCSGADHFPHGIVIQSSHSASRKNDSGSFLAVARRFCKCKFLRGIFRLQPMAESAMLRPRFDLRILFPRR
jgi:hypothetical protein